LIHEKLETIILAGWVLLEKGQIHEKGCRNLSWQV